MFLWQLYILGWFLLFYSLPCSPQLHFFLWWIPLLLLLLITSTRGVVLLTADGVPRPTQAIMLLCSGCCGNGCCDIVILKDAELCSGLMMSSCDLIGVVGIAWSPPPETLTLRSKKKVVWTGSETGVYPSTCTIVRYTSDLMPLRSSNCLQAS